MGMKNVAKKVADVAMNANAKREKNGVYQAFRETLSALSASALQQDVYNTMNDNSFYHGARKMIHDGLEAHFEKLTQDPRYENKCIVKPRGAAYRNGFERVLRDTVELCIDRLPEYYRNPVMQEILRGTITATLSAEDYLHREVTDGKVTYVPIEDPTLDNETLQTITGSVAVAVAERLLKDKIVGRIGLEKYDRIFGNE